MIDDATRIRVIMALLGITSKGLAERIGVTQGVVTGWTKGRFAPQRKNRAAIEKICAESKIMFLRGMPVPEDLMSVQENENG
jgi:predicted transcriptional regulator